MRSSTTASYPPSRARCRPSTPSWATSTTNPSAVSPRRTAEARRRSSSTTSTRTVPVWPTAPGAADGLSGCSQQPCGTVGYMTQVPKLSRRSRWAIPAGALAVTAWLWQSTLNKVTKFTLPAKSAAKAVVPQQPLTPQQAAQQVLAAVGPTTTVKVDSNVTVAGQAAYALVLAPKDARSLIGQVQIDVDGSNGVPLRLQVFARRSSSPAFQVGYTDIHFVKPAAADLSLAPPPGPTATKGNLSDHAGGARDHATPDVTTIGSGWLTVLELPSSD